jgi:hypothetical protein
MIVHVFIGSPRAKRWPVRFREVLADEEGSANSLRKLRIILDITPPTTAVAVPPAQNSAGGEAGGGTSSSAGPSLGGSCLVGPFG